MVSNLLDHVLFLYDIRKESIWELYSGCSPLIPKTETVNYIEKLVHPLVYKFWFVVRNRSPDMAAMHQDTSEDHEVVHEKLMEIFRVMFDYSASDG